MNTKFDIGKAEKVVLAGGSAGGISAFLWEKYLRTVVENKNGVSTVADSGVFINTASTQTGKYVSKEKSINLFKLANIDEKTPNQVCNNFKAGE